MVIKPYAYEMWEYAQSFLDKELKDIGVKNAYFPLLIPEGLLQKEQEHVEGFTPEVAWVTEHGNTKFEERLAIRPTSETIMYDSYKKWIRSYKDLPLKINQWCNIVRWEFKHPVPFLRTREFLWQEGHTVFATKKEADKEVMQILNIYEKVFEELYAVPVIRGTKTETEKFAGAKYTVSIEALMPNGKAIQAASAHMLGQNFSKPFDITFLDKNGKKQYAWQNSWGFSTRSLGILFSVHGDDKGLVLPPRIAPTQIVIIPILFSNKPSTNQRVLKKAEELKKELTQSNIRVELDAREEYSPGHKFNHWELKGTPLRIEIGPKDLEKEHIMMARRDNGVKESVPMNESIVRSLNLLAEIQDDMFKKANKLLDNHIEKAENMNDIKKAIDKENIVLISWCGSSECEEKIKNKTGAKSLNIPIVQPKKIGKCLCGKKGKYMTYFGKSY